MASDNDNQKLENLQVAAARLETGKRFGPNPREPASRTECQVFVKNSTEKRRSDSPVERSKTDTKPREKSELADWLGVRDGIRNYLITAA